MNIYENDDYMEMKNDGHLEKLEEIYAEDFDGRCYNCGSQNLTELEEINDICKTIICERCDRKFYLISVNEIEKTTCLNCGKEVRKDEYKDQIEHHKRVVQCEDCSRKQEDLEEYFEG